MWVVDDSCFCLNFNVGCCIKYDEVGNGCIVINVIILIFCINIDKFNININLIVVKELDV